MNSLLKKVQSRGHTLKLGKVISEAVEAKGWQKKVTEMNAVNSWNKENIGTRICSNAQAYHIENGKLYVLVSNSTWMNELSFLKPQIIKNINQAVGKSVVEDIQFKIGNIRKHRNQSKTNEAKRKKSGKTDLEKVELKQEVIDKIDEVVSEIDDQDLRESFRKAIIVSSKIKQIEEAYNS